MSQMANFVRDAAQLEAMRKALKRFYPLIKAVFRHYAASKDVRSGDIFNMCVCRVACLNVTTTHLTREHGVCMCVCVCWGMD